MQRRAAIWAIALATVVGSWTTDAFGGQAILPGHEAQVLALVKRAVAAQKEAPTYDVRIEQEAILLRLSAPEEVTLVVHYQGPVPSELAPGVQLTCEQLCSAAQRSRWQALATALAQERDRQRDVLWVQVGTPAEDEEREPGGVVARVVWGLVALFGLGWIAVYGVRCLTAINWRERKLELSVSIGICAVSALIALGLTAHLPLHEHNSYVARSDCAWMLDCIRDPAGPGWSPAFFRAYGPLLHTFPYGVANLCRFTLAVGLLAGLLARHWLVKTLVSCGWSGGSARSAGLWALALTCLNPLWIRVAVAGTPWPYVVLCLFAAGIAAQEAVAGSRAKRLIAGTAGTCLLALAVNSNLVMLSALPLVWLGPALCRSGRRWWLPTAWQVTGATLCLALTVESIEIFRAALMNGANPRTRFALHHVFFDGRFLPATLALFLVVGVFASLRRRSAIWALIYIAVVTHPTLTNYAGPPLGPDYPVSLLNAYLGVSLGSVLAAIGVMWLIERASRVGRRRLAWGAAVVALLLPAALAREGWRFLTGSRVAERELAAISSALPRLPPHTQLVIPSRIQPQPAGVKSAGDPLELRFPVGEYLASQHRLGRSPPVPIPLDAMGRRDTPSLAAPGVLLYVGASQRSFFQSEIDAGVVPEDLRRSELEALCQRFELIPVSTFELTPAQHPAIPWQLGAGRATRVELGFYRLEPKAR